MRQRSHAAELEPPTEMDEAEPRRTWWDTREEPPPALMNLVASVSRRLSREHKPRAETRLGAIVATAVVALVLLALIWVVFLAVAEQL